MKNASARTLLLLPLFFAACGTLQVDAPGECPVHAVPLQSMMVNVRSSAPRQEYLDARQESFPFPGTLFSGEIAPNTSEPRVPVQACPECRQAEQAWIRENQWR